MIDKLRSAHLLRGEKSEQQACRYLIKQGLLLVEKNFRSKYGELDLLMMDGQTLVIVEVRYRKSNVYGSAVESITAKKQLRIIAAAQYYMLVNKTDSLIRFDVISMSSDSDINWIKNAF